ncbi:MAG: hypothetical protein JXQ29_15605 [Planctomycetes bacterium]|nr:hypothetical protein [Planctomycetota bacterium]
MIDAVIATLYVAALWIGGWLTACAILGSGSRARGLAAAGGFPVGLFVFTYAAFLLMLAGVPFRPPTICGLLAALLLLGGGLAWRRPKMPGGHRARPVPGRTPTHRLVGTLLAVVLAAIVVGRVRETLITPWQGDGLAFWRLKAVVIAAEGTVRTPSFTHPSVVHNHKRYPLLQPIANAGLLVLRPDLRPAAQMAVHAAALLGLYGLLYAALRQRSGPVLARLLLILFGLSPAGASGGGYVTATLALYLLGAALFARRWRDGRARGDAAVFLLMAAGLVFTKNEGAILALLVYATLLVRPHLGVRLPRRGLLFHAIAAAALLVSWFAFKLSLPATFDPPVVASLEPLREVLARFVYAVYLLGYEVLAFEVWGPLWVLVLWALARRGDPVLRLVPAVFLLFYLFVAAVHPEELCAFVPNTLRRVLAQLAPLGLLLVASRLGAWFETRADPT